MSVAPERGALHSALSRLAHGEPLSAADVTDAFAVIMNGGASEMQVAAVLTGLRVRGETPEIVAGVARALRDVMIRLPVSDASDLVDTCGTGGGSVQTFNISTAAAFLAAGWGIRIAKHGNRSFTSRCGSADVLEALGVPIEATLETMTHALEAAGIVFMYAPRMHPAMRYVGPVRRELAIPTVMNVVGPLANPAGVTRQVLGVADSQRVRMLAEALVQLETQHAMVVHGEPGLDEISPIGRTRVVEIKGGRIDEWVLDPAEFGFSGFSAEELAGGDPQENAGIITRVLAGQGTAGAEAAVVLNAAAAIYVSGRVPDFSAGVEAARGAMAEGAGAAALERLREAYG